MFVNFMFFASVGQVSSQSNGHINSFQLALELTERVLRAIYNWEYRLCKQLRLC